VLTGSALSDLAIERSACVVPPVTVVLATAVLSDGSRSVVAAEIVAEFWRFPFVAGAVTLMTIVRVPATGTFPRVHVTTPAAWLQFQPDPVPLVFTKVTPAGRVSVTVIVWAVLGPALDATSVYASAAPAFTGSGLSVFVIETSATAAIAVVSVSELFAPTDRRSWRRRSPCSRATCRTRERHGDGDRGRGAEGEAAACR
jgi:hypothetical protein